MVTDVKSITAAGIVLFLPDIDMVKANIQSLLNQVDHVYLVDNTENDTINDCFNGVENVTYVSDGVNKGIAKALNILMGLAEEAGYEWLLTLDQDSIIPERMVEDLFLYSDKDIAVIAPCYIDRNTGRQVGIEGFTQKCITSGSLNYIDAWRQIKGFDEYMFIDYVDFEYCERLRNNGWKIYQTKKVILNHAIGKTEYKILFGRELDLNIHSAFSKYYQMRNYINWQMKMGRFSLGSTVLRYLVWSIKVVLWEDDKMRKLREMTKGVKDGILHS